LGDHAASRNRAGRGIEAHTNIIMQDGGVDLWGLVRSDKERRAMIVAMEGVPGVRCVEDHMAGPVPSLL
jgi:osmotically-inducible protein OsmY